MKLNILGTVYTVTQQTSKNNAWFTQNKCDGYCDKTSKKIVIRAKENDCDLDNWEAYNRKVLRHEIIHAFLFESGLGENWSHSDWGHDETYVDWFAFQYPKIRDVFKKANCDF